MPCSVWAGRGEDVLRLLKLAEVDKGGREREQRLDVAGIGGDPAVVARGVAQQFEPVVDLALVPGYYRLGDQGCRDRIAVMLTGGREDGIGYGSAEPVTQPCKGLQLRG